MIAAVLVLWVGGFAYMFRDAFFFNTETSNHLSTVDLEKRRALKLEKRRELQEKLRAVNASGIAAETELAAGQNSGEVLATALQNKESVGGVEILTGWVTIVDKWGHQSAKLRASVLDGGWLALPARACYGGWKWFYSPDTGGEYELHMGRWGNGDTVGLWQVDNQRQSSVKGISLNKWNEKEAVTWYSIETLKEQQNVILSAVRGWYGADFVEVSLPGDIAETGIFVQNSQVVGWSFGDWLFNGYLWIGKSGNVTQNTQISDFYRATFSGGREEKIAEALSLAESSSAINMVSLLVDALLAPAKLASDDTPFYLQPPAALKVLRKFVSAAVRAGYGRNILDVLTDDVLLKLGDIDLFLSVIPAVTASHGFASAINLIENTGSAIVAQGRVDVPVLNQKHLTIYQDWLQSLVTVKETDEAWDVLTNARDFYPDDAYLYLLGVELEILNGDWQKAEQLLYAREYPPGFQDRFQLLSRRISELKSAEGKIVIRFAPNSNKINVISNLNGSLAQEFLVDTGASMVTIPYETVDALNLEFVAGYHGGQRMVSTAGGLVSAEEVVINSLEIGGWIEYNVKALVLDIPDQPGVGLLGLNYLGRFQMDLRNDEGVLLLSPR